MKYTDLIFDLYGTLVDIHTEESDSVWEKTAIYFGFYGAHYTGRELKETFQQEIARLEENQRIDPDSVPDIPYEPVMADLFRQKGVVRCAENLGKHAAQLLRILSIDYIRLYPHVFEALASFRQQGCRLWLLSNAQNVFTAYELQYLGLTNYFDGIYISSNFGFRKPDVRFFRALLDEQNLNPKKCLMIGNDRFTDIAGAKRAGIDSLYMHTNLTPQDQAPADPSKIPGKASNTGHYEFEGSDWKILLKHICEL